MIHSVRFSYDVRLAFSGEHIGRLMVWDSSTGAQVKEDHTLGSLPVVRLSITTDSSLVLITGSCNQAVVWDWTVGKKFSEFLGTDFYLGR